MTSKKDLLSASDLGIDELKKIIALSAKVKKRREDYRNFLDGKKFAMIFEKPSTRTRVSFDIAIYELGGHSIYISPKEMQFARGESAADSARVLERYVDCIIARVNHHEFLVELSDNCSIPVINALSDIEHPCQAISDIFTISEASEAAGCDIEKVKLAYLGDGNNVCNSLLIASSMMGIDITIASPENYSVNKDILEKARKISKISGGIVRTTTDPKDAVSDVDFIYTDVWVSMGDEDDATLRSKIFSDYQLNSDLIKAAKRNCRIMHCLPAHRGEEITDEVMDGKTTAQVLVWDQAENKMHAQKAILMLMMERLEKYG